MPDSASTDAAAADTTSAATDPVTRRRFVVGVAAAGALAAAASAVGRPAATASAQGPLSQGVIVADPSLCIGCLACEVNCGTWHASVGRSSVPRIRVLRTSDVKLNPAVASLAPQRAGFTPQTCRQCPTPWCVPNCPTQGLHIDPKTGTRILNEQNCVACGKCEVDCPVEWKGTLALKSQPVNARRVTYDPKKNVYAKCDLCAGRDGGPICVERCPVNVAIRTGTIRSDHPCLDVKPSTQQLASSLT